MATTEDSYNLISLKPLTRSRSDAVKGKKGQTSDASWYHLTPVSSGADVGTTASTDFRAATAAPYQLPLQPDTDGKAVAAADRRRRARTTLEEELADFFASLNASLAAVDQQVRHEDLDPGDLYDLADVLVEHQAALGYRFQVIWDHAERLDDDLGSSANSDFLGGPEVIHSRNKLDDTIVGLLTEVQSTLTRKLGSAERCRSYLADKLVLDKVRRETYQFYYYLPVGVLLFMWVVVLALELSSSSGSSYWVTVLRVVRGPLLTLTFVYLLSVNISGWAKVRIDYVALFAIKYVRGITPKDAFRFAGVVTLLYGALLATGMFLSATGGMVPILLIGLAMWIVLLSLVLSPFPCMQRGARYSFVASFARVALTPLFRVTFGDGWLADQLLSTVAVVLDFEYLACYLVLLASSANVVGANPSATCLASYTGIRPAIVALPAVWRLLQCLRSYRDTLSSVHLLNAGKYLSSLPVIAFSVAYELSVPPDFTVSSLSDLEKGGWVVVGWVITSAANIAYSFLWDVLCDWKLVNFGRCCMPHLRRQRLYRWRAVYVVIMPLDLVLRILSTLKLTFTLVRHVPHSETIFTFLIFSEFVRRFVWNYFRVEVESFKTANENELPSRGVLL